jgi:hypothetical protein
MPNDQQVEPEENGDMPLLDSVDSVNRTGEVVTKAIAMADHDSIADRKASKGFDRLWKSNRPCVCRLVARLAGNADLAEDLTQEVALKALQGFRDFRGDAAWSTWIYQIAVLHARRGPWT